MKKYLTCLISLLLVASMLFTMPAAVVAVENDVPESTYLLESDRPEAVSQDLIKRNQHIYRLREEETNLNEIFFLNADGTATLYSFSEPVKYIDSSGHVRDKSNCVYSTFDMPSYSDKYAYVNRINDINTYFPKTLGESSGVLLVGNGHKIEMMPICTTETTTKANASCVRSNEYIYYNNVFGDGTAVRYSPTFSGFKEDIILQFNEGNRFRFLLKTGGLVAKQEGTAVNLVDGKTGELCAQIEPIYVYDSYAGKGGAHTTYENEVKLKPLNDGNIEIELVIDDSFLSNPDTVYPVYIDPSVTINTSGSGSTKSIQDCPIYSGTDAATLASGSNTYNLVGFIGQSGGAQYGVGRTLMRFPGLLNNGYYKAVPANQIQNVTLYITESSGQASSTTLSAYQYTGSSAWVEKSANYNNVSWSGYGTFYGSATIGSSGATTAAINITSAGRAWKSNSTYANAGILIRNSNETGSAYRKDLRSTENSSSKPYISMTFTWYGCRPYYSTTSQTMNCQGYAFWTHNDPQNWYTEEDAYYWYSSATLSQKLERTKQRLESNWLPQNFPNGRWENVTSQGLNASLNDKQWLVVMRVGFVNTGSTSVFDYHFWYRTNNGQWSNKHGTGGYSELLPLSDTPTTNSSDGWALFGYYPFYSSAVVYYRVTMP